MPGESKQENFLIHVTRGKYEEVESLLKDDPLLAKYRGSDRKQTALHLSAMCGHVRIAKLLIEYGADINAVDINDVECEDDPWHKHYNETPLHIAVNCYKHSIVELLLSEGAKVNLHNAFNQTALDLAYQSQTKYSDQELVDKIIKLLKNSGAKKYSHDLESPRQVLLFSKYKKELLKINIDENCRDDYQKRLMKPS
jgi:ankyrin repeat protein